MPDDFRDHPLNAHPVMTGSPSVGLMTAEAPKFPTQDPRGNEGLESDLRGMNLSFEKTRGRYEVPENSYIIYGPTKDQMYSLGQKYGQEAVIHHQAGGLPHELLYTNGPYAGKSRLSEGHEFFDKEPEDYYTMVPGHGFVRLAFDFKGEPPHMSMPLVKRESGITWSPVVKCEAGRRHPHAYEWLAGHTQHALLHAGPGVQSVALSKSETDDDHSPATFQSLTMPFGTSHPGRTSSYPYDGMLGHRLADVRRLVAQHGYSTHYYAGRFGRPDLAKRNYDTHDLWIHDPATGSVADRDFTDAWRQTHELAHALTHKDVNDVYGEGRRIGKLGSHRTLHEALRAVNWEHLAVHKQRQLLGQLGVHVPDEVFNRETNTVMADAVHRAVTGKFASPDSFGFSPHPHRVPLEVAHQVVRDAAAKLGLTAPHQLLAKAEGRQSSWPNRSLRT